MVKHDDRYRPASDAAGLRLMINGYKQSRLVMTGLELGLFDHLGEGGVGAEELAAALGTEPRATSRLADALVSLGLLSKAGGHYGHTELSRRYLTSDSPEFMASAMHAVQLWTSWGRLTEVVRQGEPPEARFREKRDPEGTRRFIGAMHYFADQRAGETLAALDLTNARRVLDVGGGSGAYTLAFLEALGPEATGTVLDLPNVLPLTRRYVAEAGLAERIDFVEGNYNEVAFPDGYDLVFLSAVVHINSPAENAALIRKAAGALRPGGQVVVRDYLVNEERTGPAVATLFAINMLVNTRGGDAYTESEIRSWLTAAGLTQTDCIRLDEATGLVVGRAASQS